MCSDRRKLKSRSCFAAVWYNCAGCSSRSPASAMSEAATVHEMVVTFYSQQHFPSRSTFRRYLCSLVPDAEVTFRQTILFANGLGARIGCRCSATIQSQLVTALSGVGRVRLLEEPCAQAALRVLRMRAFSCLFGCPWRRQSPRHPLNLLVLLRGAWMFLRVTFLRAAANVPER